MQLPLQLRRAIEQELTVCNPARLRAVAESLSERYREQEGDGVAPGLLAGVEQRAAYLAVRMPATFAAVMEALRWVRESYGGEVDSVLDLGSGPGTALWAAAQTFPTLRSAAAFERDTGLIAIGQRLMAEAGSAVLRDAKWLQGDLTMGIPDGTWDLVVCSYALNELGKGRRDEFIRRAWSRTAKVLVIIEPGTKAGFANILAVRGCLLAEGSILLAPCPSSLGCPMERSGDWCHFAARVERTAEHRRLKSATLGHEDEKFSYIAFARDSGAHNGPSPVQIPSSRIVRHPKIFSGYTQITLCRNQVIEDKTVTRSHKEDWRRLKRLGWGDGW